MFYSPLRYPGGKNKLSEFVAKICEKNNINGHYVEPYAGGASVALYLLLEGKVAEITINDFDRSIYAFWWAVLNETSKLCKLIEKTEVDISEWHKQKEIHKNKKTSNLLELGFSTFFLNRTNISGIIDGGVIGGLDQTGKYKIDCRFNKAALIDRIENIAKFEKQIHLTNLDALDLIDEISNKAEKNNTIFYFDPPYYLKGPSLYYSHYKSDDHKNVSEKIKDIKDIHWIVSYDDVSQINKFYKGSRTKKHIFRHTARSSRIGKEILFFSQDLSLPRSVR